MWSAARRSDGISFLRVIETGDDVLRLTGHIYDIEQRQYAFWLELTRESMESVRWLLYFDVITSSDRKARDLLVVTDRAHDIEWRHALSGLADFRDGKLVVAKMP